MPSIRDFLKLQINDGFHFNFSLLEKYMKNDFFLI